jgi:hypothetical protein
MTGAYERLMKAFPLFTMPMVKPLSLAGLFA